jgi:hypothetical protein
VTEQPVAPLPGQITIADALVHVTPVARRTDPATSHEAAASVDLRDSHRAVADCFDAYVELTDEELLRVYRQRQVGHVYPAQSDSGLRTRRRELVDLGVLENSGRKARMETGRMAIVWQLRAGVSE